VSPWGSIREWDAGREHGRSLDWFIAADDRWHVPAQESAVRQRLIEGTPVIETRVRIPGGDAVQRTYAVADHGGLTIIQVDNESPSPVAIAFAGLPLLSVRPPADMPLEGIDLPDDAVAFPIGHRSTLTVAIATDRPRRGALPADVPTFDQVVRGWTAVAERASRLSLPIRSVSEEVVRARCQLLLEGPAHAHDNPIEFLLGVGEMLRMGSAVGTWMPEVADAVAGLAKWRSDTHLAAALDAAERVCLAAGEARAARDLAKVRSRLGAAPAGAVGESELSQSVSGVRLIASVERQLVIDGDLLPTGIPAAWLGQNFEVHGVPAGSETVVSFAVRWHGTRPAVLWEQTGAPLTLTSTRVAPDWSGDQLTGEALWPAPAGAVAPASAEDVSFS
jgi:hypothetical protein